MSEHSIVLFVCFQYFPPYICKHYTMTIPSPDTLDILTKPTKSQLSNPPWQQHLLNLTMTDMQTAS